MTPQRAWQKRQRERIRCQRCGGWAGPASLVYCDPCKTQRQASQTASKRALRERRIAEGCCYYCAAHALPGLSVCLKHKLERAENTARYNARRQEAAE